MSRNKRKNPAAPRLSRHQEYLLFLQGCLYAATREYYRPPASPEAYRHFYDGEAMVRAGTVRIADPPAMRQFIAEVEAGWRPGQPTKGD